MYIAPNTTIVLLSGVPLDNTYTDTIYFNSKGEQYNHFYGVDRNRYNRKIFLENSYQRVENNRLRISASSDDLYNCNYMMFRNTNFGNKWFYAFITNAPKYINNAVTEIEYEIDDMQTWFFDYKLEECLVERETQATDVAGDNLLDEPVATGELICESMETTPYFNYWGVLVTTAADMGHVDNDDLPISVGGDDNPVDPQNPS